MELIFAQTLVISLNKWVKLYCLFIYFLRIKEKIISRFFVEICILPLLILWIVIDSVSIDRCAFKVYRLDISFYAIPVLIDEFQFLLLAVKNYKQ